MKKLMLQGYLQVSKQRLKEKRREKIKTITLFTYAEIWFMLMLMLKCCERKILLAAEK